MKRRAAILLVCIGLALSACQSSSLENEIMTYLDNMAANDFFSGVVLVAHQGEPILELAYGLANRIFQVPNTIETRFNLGSMNKMFTSVAILQLVEQGKISLDDEISLHLLDYPNHDLATKVTIHHLLTHTSGLGDIFTEVFLDTPKDGYRTVQDYLPLFVDQPLQFEPGSQAAYSNAGYIVLGLIIEEISGLSYYDYVRENIFKPCGMEDTDSYQVDQIAADIAVGYTRQIKCAEGLSSNVYFMPARGSSAGGGYSTAHDLLNFSTCLMEHQLLNEELTELMLENKVQLTAGDLTFEYAYGFMILENNQHLFVGHSGGAPGVCSSLDIFLDLGYTVVVLSNSDFDCRPVRKTIRQLLTQ
jgi:CubicO group peptidase (beta-lactamase class C family)